MAEKIVPTAETPSDEARRDFLTTVTACFGAAGAAAAAYPFIRSMTPAADVKAQATVELSIADVAEGQYKTVLWRGRPVFVKHRTQKEIDQARADDTVGLPDPQKDADRVKEGKEKWLVTLAVCTHLGCVPMQGGEFGGWMCPCHGSHYDTSGRIRKGPAPLNLEVPPYAFVDDTTIRIG